VHTLLTEQPLFGRKAYQQIRRNLVKAFRDAGVDFATRYWCYATYAFGKIIHLFLFDADKGAPGQSARLHLGIHRPGMQDADGHTQTNTEAIVWVKKNNAWNNVGQVDLTEATVSPLGSTAS
jgi:hypothetical protein